MPLVQYAMFYPELYSLVADGNIILKMPRLFFIAEK